MKKILIVEDELIPAKLLQTLLKKEGYVVLEIIKTGESAVEFTKSFIPDLILMDIRLQGEMDGIDAMKAIRKFSEVPVIYVTGNSDLKTKSRAEETNASGYFVKPYDSNYLIDAVKKIFSII